MTGSIEALTRENAELRAYLKAFCAATVEPEDLGRDVSAHEANPFIEYEFVLCDEDGPMADRTITGGQVRPAMELVGFDKLKITPSDRTISEELTEARDQRRALMALKASVPVPETGTEERSFWLEAADQHGIREVNHGVYAGKEQALLTLMAAAREQGRKDALAAISNSEG